MTKNETPPHRPLNPRQRHFLDRYHITGNLGQSWLDAGYTCSIESASSNAGRVLQREDAQEYLQSLQQNDRDKSGCSREMIIDRFKQILFSENARDRDVIQAGREIARMIGAYNPPEKKPEPKVDTLHEFIKRVRAGEHPEEEKSLEPPATPHRQAYADYHESSTALWLPDPSPEDSSTSESRSDNQPSDESPQPEENKKAQTPSIYESPLDQLARTKKERATRAEKWRDPDWHPQYNPYYDPTSDLYQKPQKPITIRPGMR